MNTADEVLLEVIEDARMVLAGAEPSADAVMTFAQALVQIGDRCVIGLPCEKHCGQVHGQEAEELRAGVEKILRDTAEVDDAGEAVFVLIELRQSLIVLLDDVDARDSLAFRDSTGEATC